MLLRRATTQFAQLAVGASPWFARPCSGVRDWTRGNRHRRERARHPPLKRQRRPRRAARFRVLAVEALGPLTVLGGIVWALAQPYRVTFFYPDGKGLWDWLVQPPLLVVLVGLLFSWSSRPGWSTTSSNASASPELLRAEIAHWLFGAGFLFFALVLLAEAIVGPSVRRRAWRATCGRASCSSPACGSGSSRSSRPRRSTCSRTPPGRRRRPPRGAVQLAVVRGRLASPYWSLVTAGGLLVSGSAFLIHEQNGWLFARSAFLHHLIGWTMVIAVVFPLGAAFRPALAGVGLRLRRDLDRGGGDALLRSRHRPDLRAPVRVRERGHRAVRRAPRRRGGRARAAGRGRGTPSTRAIPAEQGRVAVPPTSIELFYDQSVVAADAIVVMAASGRRVSGAVTQAQRGTVIRVPVSGLERGRATPSAGARSPPTGTSGPASSPSASASSRRRRPGGRRVRHDLARRRGAGRSSPRWRSSSASSASACSSCRAWSTRGSSVASTSSGRSARSPPSTPGSSASSSAPRTRSRSPASTSSTPTSRRSPSRRGSAPRSSSRPRLRRLPHDPRGRVGPRPPGAPVARVPPRTGARLGLPALGPGDRAERVPRRPGRRLGAPRHRDAVGRRRADARGRRVAARPRPAAHRLPALLPDRDRARRGARDRGDDRRDRAAPGRLRPLDDVVRADPPLQDRPRARRPRLGRHPPHLRAAAARAGRADARRRPQPPRGERRRHGRAPRRRGARGRRAAARGDGLGQAPPAAP